MKLCLLNRYTGKYNPYVCFVCTLCTMCGHLWAHIKPIYQIWLLIWVNFLLEYMTDVDLSTINGEHLISDGLHLSVYPKFPHFKPRVAPQLRHRHHCSVTYWIMHVLMVFNQGSGEKEIDVWETGSEESVVRRGRKQQGVCVCVRRSSLCCGLSLLCWYAGLNKIKGHRKKKETNQTVETLCQS